MPTKTNADATAQTNATTVDATAQVQTATSAVDPANPIADQSTVTAAKAPIVFDKVSAEDMIADAIRAMQADGALTIEGKVDSVSLKNQDEDDPNSRMQYVVTLGGAKGAAYLFPNQISRLVPFGIDVEDDRIVRNILKFATAECVQLEVSAGEEFKFNLYSDKTFIASKDRLINYVTALKFPERIVRRIEDKIIDSAFG